MLTPPKSTAPKACKPESKPLPTAEQIYEMAKDSSSRASWANLLTKSTSPTGRGERKLPSKPEEVFESWKGIFTEENAKPETFDKGEGIEKYFKEWAEANLKEPELRKRRESEMDESPKTSRKEMKKQIRSENIEDDITEVKENRRQAFAKNAAIKDRKRGEAARNSTGKRIK